MHVNETSLTRRTHFRLRDVLEHSGQCPERRPPSVLERWRDQAGHHRVRGEGDEGGLSGLRAAFGSHCHLRQRRHVVGGAPDVHPTRLCAGPREGAAPKHPEWKDKQPFKALLDNDMEGLAAGGQKSLVELLMASHAGMSTAEFEQIVTDWFKTARHPRFKRPYTELCYAPMVELLGYLRAHGFKTYIVSGGGVEFMRPMTEAVYGIPPEQVIGSTIVTQYEIKDGKPVLMRLPKVDFIDDKTGKPVGINKFIGRRPIAAFGNSAGDREMLEWTGAGSGKRLMMLVFHDDSVREYAYGPANGLPDTKFGAFPASLMEEAKQKGWDVISMKNDWARVFAFEQ